MATYEITGPDGALYRIEGPEGATREQVIERVKASVSGAPQQPKGSFLDKVVSVAESAKDALSPRSGAGGAIVQAAGRGLAALGMPWLENEMKANNSAEDARLQGLRDKAGFTGMDLTKTVASAANPSSLALLPAVGAPAANIVGRSVQGGAISGLQSLLTPVKDPSTNYLEQKGKGAVEAGLLGLIGTPIIEGATRAVGAVASPMINAIRTRMQPPVGPGPGDIALSQQLAAHGVDFASLADSVKQQLREQAQRALSAGGQVNADAVQRASDFARAGVNPTKGQLTRDPVQWSWEMNKRGAIDDLAARFNEQGGALTDRLRTLQNTSGPAMGPFDAGTKIIDSLRNVDNNLSMKTTSAYNKWRASSGATADVPMQPIAQRLGETLDTYGVENIPGAVMRKLEGFGLMGGKQTKVFDLLEADKLLKVLNANFDPMNKPQAAALGGIRKGLNEAIDSMVAPEGAPAVAQLREAIGLAKQRFQLIDKTEGLRAAIGGNAKAEDFVRKYVESGSVADLESMMKLLPKDAAQVMQRQLIDRIAGRAFNREGDQALQNVSHAGLKNAQDAITPDRLNRALPPDILDQLGLLTRVSGYIQTAPRGSYVNSSNSAVEAMRSGLGLLGKVPGAPLVMKLGTMAGDTLQTGGALNPGPVDAFSALTPELRKLLAQRVGLASGLLAPEVLSQ